MSDKIFSSDIINKKSILFQEKGQALVEALVAISIMTMGFMAIFSLLSRSLALNRSSADSYTASYLAAEGIEVARNIVDSNPLQRKAWNDSFSSGDYEVEYNSVSLAPNQDRFLAYDPDTNLYSYSGFTQTHFKRLIRIALIGSNEIKVNSIVSWIGAGGGSFRVNAEDHFINWRY